MAHEIKKILIDKEDEFKCSNDLQQSANNVCTSKLVLNSPLLDNLCLSSSNQNLLNQKNSSTKNTNMIASTQQSLPQAQLSSLMKNSSGSKFSLNSSGASMSTISSSATTTSTITKSPQTTGTKMGSRRIFTPQFKLQVLESYRNDNDCKGNQRATARKYGIHRRQIQKWLQCENNLRSIIANNPQNVRNNQMKLIPKVTAPILSSSTSSRQRGVVNTDKNGATYSCFSLANVKNFKANNNVGSSSTKSLSSSSPLSLGEFSSKSCSNNIATALETSKHVFTSSPFCYDNDSHVNNIYSSIIEDHPIDLSCNQTKIKIENVARPIPIHPSSSHYKIPFYNYGSDLSGNKASLHQQCQTSPSPQLTDISNSIIKSELVGPIDLSTTNISQKRKHITDNKSMDDNNKQHKLFRPYLESNFETDIDKCKKSKQDDTQKFPIIWSNNYNFYHEHIQSDYHPFLMTCSQSIYHTDSQNAFQVPPVTPPPLSSLSSPNDSGIMMNSNYHILLPLSQASPVSGYDSSTSSIYSFNDNEVDLSQGNSPTYTSSHYDASSPSFSSATMSPTATETKVPLSPSLLHDLKFKLHAIDCYYNDVDCKRNEKLVAKKLNINCKIVEKWLRQESDLRKQYHLQILV